MLDENWWSWQRAMEHANFLLGLFPGNRYRVYKTNTSLGWTVTYADSSSR